MGAVCGKKDEANEKSGKKNALSNGDDEYITQYDENPAVTSFALSSDNINSEPINFFNNST